MTLSASAERQIAKLQAQILGIAGEIQISEAVLSLSHDERWGTLRGRLQERLDRVLGQVTAADVEDRERAFLCGSIKEIRLIMAAPDDIRAGSRSIDSMKKAADALRRQIEQVKEKDQMWGQDPNL